VQTCLIFDVNNFFLPDLLDVSSVRELYIAPLPSLAKKIRIVKESPY